MGNTSSSGDIVGKKVFAKSDFYAAADFVRQLKRADKDYGTLTVV